MNDSGLKLRYYTQGKVFSLSPQISRKSITEPGLVSFFNLTSEGLILAHLLCHLRSLVLEVILLHEFMQGAESPPLRIFTWKR